MKVQSQFIEMFGECQRKEKLSSLCETFIDGDWIESKDQSEDGIRLVQTGNVGYGYFKDKEDKSRYISEETFNRLHCTEIFAGDILVSRLPDPIGRACIIPEGIGRMITAVDCSIIRLKDVILPEYFISYTMTSTYSAQINEVTTGTTRRRVSRANLGNVLVPCPSLEAQRQFVAISQQADKSKFVGFKSRFIEMFGDPVSWQTDTSLPTLNDTVNVISGFPFDSEKFDTEGVGTPLIRIRDIQRGYSETFTTEAFDEQYRINKYELLVGMDGMFDIARWQSDEAALNQRVCCLRMKGSENDTFIQYLVQPILKHIENGTNATTVKHISTKQINGIRVPIASYEQKNKFAMIANQADKSKFELRESIKSIDKVIKSLINII